MDYRSKFYAASFAAILATFVAIVTGFATLTQTTPKPEVVPRVTPGSTIGQAEGFMLRGLSGLSPKQADIVWMDPNSGQGISEKFLFTRDNGSTPLAPEGYRKVLAAVKDNGLVRTEQYCRGVEAKTGEWSLGYCVNRVMKSQVPNVGGGPVG